MKNDWFKDWFASEEYLNVYNHRDNSDAHDLISLILQTVNVDKNATLLDAACGSGRHSNLLAEMGYDVTAFDLSETLLNLAKEKAKENNLKIDYFSSDIRDVKLEKKFDLVLNLFTSFGYFDDDKDNFKFLENALYMLKPNGFFVLDYLNKDYLVYNLVPKSEKNVNGKQILENRFIENNRVEKEITILENGHKKQFNESVKLYDKDELVDSVKNIGFNVYKVFGDYKGTEFIKDSSKRVVLILQK